MNAALRTVGLLAVCVCACWTVLTAPGRIERWADRQAEATRTMAAGELRAAVAVLDARAASLERTADARLADIARRADARMAGLESLADRHLGALTARADARAGEAVLELGRLRADLKPVLDGAAGLEATASRALAMWTPQVNGLIAGWKVTGGETAQAMKRLDAALPQFIARMDRIAANSDRTTAASAGLFRNLEQATKPLPRWMRIGLGVAPPLAQTGAAAASAWALIGR